MKKTVTIFLLLLTVSISINAYAQSERIALKPDRVSVDPINVFLNPPKYIRSFLPQGHQNSPLSVDWVNYIDTVDQQFAYVGIPGTINVSTGGTGTFKDTIVGYSERFTSPYTSTTYLDSVQVGINIPSTGGLTANNNNYRLIISAWTQVLGGTGATKLPFPGTLIDSTSISYDSLSTLPTDMLQLVSVKMHHKKVGRNFFITVETPYDFTSDITTQNFIGLFGDSLSVDQTAPIDTSVIRGLAAGLHYSLYWEISRDQGQTYFYQNFWISALVNSQLSGVADTKLEGNGLGQNYPNPFNPATTINYSLANESHISIKLYNALGVEVATILDANEASGENQVVFNGDNLPSGTYFYTMKAGTFSATKRLVIAK
jgi:hypothetical protein